MDIENIVSNGGSSIIPVEIADTGEHNGCKFLGSEPAGNDTSKCHKNIKIWESKIYGVPKRRRFSAIRDFPSGCGPQAANVNKHECTEDTASPKVKFSLNEKGVSIEDRSPSENMKVKGDAKIEVEHFNQFRDLPMDKIVDGDLRAKGTKRLEECKDNTNANAVVQPQPSSFDSLKTDRNTSAFREFPMNCGNNVLKMNADGPAKSILSLADKMSADELKPALQREPLIRSHSSSPDSLKSDRNVCAFQDITLGYGSDALNVNTEDPAQRVSSLADKMSCDDLNLVVGKERLLENTNMDIELMPDKKENFVDGNHLQSKNSHVFECGNMVNVCGSILYGPPKRRKVSALRDFPLGCSASIYKLGMEDNTKDAVSNSNNFYVKPSVEDKSESHGKVVFNEIFKQAKDERIESGLGCKQVEVSCKHQEESVSRHNLKKNVEDGILKEALIREANKSLAIEAQEICKRDGDDIVFNDSTHGLIAEEFDNTKSPIKMASCVDNQKDEEFSRKNLMSSISKDIIRDQSVKEQENNVLPKFDAKSRLGKSSQQKSTKMLQMVEYHERKASFSAVKSQLKAIAIEFDGNDSNKMIDDVEHENVVKNNKRKCSMELEEVSPSSASRRMSENHDVVVTPGSGIIVQALMAEPNCPWRNGKHSLNTRNSSLSVEKVNDLKKTKKRHSSNASKKSTLQKLSKSRELILQDDQNENLFMDEGHKFSPSSAIREVSVTVMPLGRPSLSSMDNCVIGHNKGSPPRNKVRKVLRLFQVICRKLLQEEESKSREPGRSLRIDLKAASILKENNEWVNTGKPILGIVPGVEIGDEFHFRTELAIVGLHRPYQGGIDMTKIKNVLLATSIVAGGQSDDLDSSDVLIYSGAGGLPGNGDNPPEDQKLERGNLALKNSIEANQPVRVIRGCKEPKNDVRDGKSKFSSTFTYDGLYMVDRYWKEKVPQGYFAFKFQLTRIPGQPELAVKEVKKSKKLSARPGTCVKDISDGKERIPICVVNTVDNELPPKFKYITNIMYPTDCSQKSPRSGCNCKNGCSDSEKCECAVKNGGEIPFNYNGAIVQAKPLVYECGSSCKCPPNCHNRVSQHGIKIQLEIFKTDSMGWGVRSLNSISSGSFICEYIGELIPDSIAEHIDNDEYLFDIGHNYDDTSLWEGLPSIIPDGHTSRTHCEVEDHSGGGFTIDAAHYGNVGRFFNHSCSPNLYAQNLLYDHDDKKMPHIMFFAAENIPPLQELTYHYNYSIDKVCDAQGNIKRKDCLCGSLECSGRLY